MQRTHNYMSLSPIAQIGIDDFPRALCVYVQNKGVGPMTVRRLTFHKGTDRAEIIDGFIPMDPRKYLHTTVSEDAPKSLLDQEKLFVIQIDVSDTSEKQKELLRRTLAEITLEVEYTDIYNRRSQVKRKLDFFLRHSHG